MGNVCGGDDVVNEVSDPHSQSIDEHLEQDRIKFEQISRLLLLGPGESGKSTIFKQMKILYDDAAKLDEERPFKVNAVCRNIISNMKNLVEAHQQLSRDGQAPAIADKEAFKAFDILAQVDGPPKLDTTAAAVITKLWNDKGIQTAYEKRAMFQISDSTEYFFSPKNLNRICVKGYLPTNMDILRTRVRTSGIIEHQYRVESARFLVIDVGGQRTERGKWIYVFADVDAIVYVVSLSGYDLKLYEDDKQNRMVEALQLFKEIVNLTLFPPETSMILFLNKKDLFEEKIKKVDPASLGIPEFAGYKGGCDSKKAMAFFQELFESQSNERKVYTEFTCALDKDLMERMMKQVKSIVVDKYTGGDNPMHGSAVTPTASASKVQIDMDDDFE